MRTSTKKNILIAAGYSVVLMAGLFLGPKLVLENQDSGSDSFMTSVFPDRSSKVEKVMRIINENYVDSVEIDTVEGMAIHEILEHLDPHSAYLAPEDAQVLSDDLEGNFNGIGIEYYILNDTLLITSVNQGGPAFKAGLKHGDKILAINNKSVAGLGISPKNVVDQIRGKRGSIVELLIKRDTLRKRFNVLRDKITITSIDAAYRISEQVGYIKISRFGARTDEDFHSSLMKLKKQGMKSLILDLRDNRGGYLNSATALADEFLRNRELIVYTQGLHEPRTDYYASSKGDFEDGKLVILIDENTASASEIIAGAVQDLERGVIIGRRSFGKGLVQEQFDFGDGSALNLTTARYYTASGRSIQKPYKKGNAAYYDEVKNRFSNGELSSDGKRITDSLYNKKQAFTTKSGKILYGGGGIMPDIYVPVDTSSYSEAFYDLAAKGVLNDILFNHLVQQNSAYSNPEELLTAFKLSDSDIKRLSQMAAGKGVKVTEAQIKTSKSEIENQLKALMARYYFGDEGFYKVLNSSDMVISRSLEVLKDLPAKKIVIE